MVAAAVVGSAVVGGVASNMAASKQAGAAGKAADQQTQAAEQMRSDLAPYAGLGQQATNPLWAAMGYNVTADQSKIDQAQAQLDHYIANKNPNWKPELVQQEIQRLTQNVIDAQNGATNGQGVLTKDPNSPMNQKFQAPSQFQAPAQFQAPGTFQGTTAFQAPADFRSDVFQAPGAFVAPEAFKFDASDLENTPGYQFNLAQGQKAVQNQMASQGLGLSGAQMKGAMSFASGLADTTFNSQYNNALNANNLNYNQALSTNSQQYNQAANTQAQQYGQASNNYNMNYQNSMAAQNQNYNQAANTNTIQYNQAANTNNQQYNQYMAANNQQYNQALSQYNTNYQTAANNVNQLQYMMNLGQNSAAQSGQAGIAGANNSGNYLTQQANAQAAGLMGSANAVNNGMSNYLTYNALYGNNNQNGFGYQAGNMLGS